MPDSDEEVEVYIPELENGMISLFEWISRDRIKLEKEKIALESFECYQLLVKEIEQKYMKFLSNEEKAFVTKVQGNLRKYEKVQSEIQSIISELILSSEKVAALKEKINEGTGTNNRDTSSRLRLKLVEKKDRSLRSDLVKADMGNADRMIKELQGEFPRIEEIANKLEKRFHHNLGRFIKPMPTETDVCKSDSKTKLTIEIEIRARCVQQQGKKTRGLVRQDKNLQKKKLVREEVDANKSATKKDVLKPAEESKSSGDLQDWDEKYKEEIPMIKYSFSDGPNDKGVQTDAYDCTMDLSDGEDILLVEISEEESDE